jgi:hypothetical protein
VRVTVNLTSPVIEPPLGGYRSSLLPQRPLTRFKQ